MDDTRDESAFPAFSGVPWGRRLFDLAIGGAIVLAVVGALDLPWAAKLFPISVGTATLALWIFHVVNAWRGTRASQAAFDATSESAEGWPAVRMWGWMLGYLVLLPLLGFLPASVAFIVGFLRIEGRTSWLTVLVVGALALGLTGGLGLALNVYWPQGVLGDLVPWATTF
ncbi:tripartite tricarboxylate transporter TctB family protein [Salinarimonas sp. NSM]|uniref:tripartite tricarboxylate transporter TctB family protein n=1 Tax=Salinarimonas sp. NSM TaxID=3458003 RepID=UPI004035C4CC